MCAVMDAFEGGAREVRLFGFDFFQSGHVQEREPDGDDYSTPLPWLHSPTEERRALGRLIAENPDRLIPDAVLREALK
jgi:hypothetical protein